MKAVLKECQTILLVKPHQNKQNNSLNSFFILKNVQNWNYAINSVAHRKTAIFLMFTSIFNIKSPNCPLFFKVWNFANLPQSGSGQEAEGMNC
jgi:hypothetical protein